MKIYEPRFKDFMIVTGEGLFLTALAYIIHNFFNKCIIMKTDISKRLKLIKLYAKLPLAVAFNMMLVLSFLMLMILIVKRT